MLNFKMGEVPAQIADRAKDFRYLTFLGEYPTNEKYLLKSLN